MNQKGNIDVTHALADLKEALLSVRADIFSIWFPLQLGLIALAAAIALGAMLIVRPRMRDAQWTASWPPVLRQLFHAVIADLGLIVFILIVVTLRGVMLDLVPPARSYLLSVAASLATAWVAVSIFAALIRNHLVNRVVAVSLWTIAALSILGILQPISRWLDEMAIVVGGLRLSLLLLLKALILLLLTLWAAIAASNFLDKQLRRSTDLTPSVQVLVGKLIRLTLVTLSVLIVLSSVGIDLSALALFSGAVGVGVGFGLQKIVSNLVSGIILLADKSIKPGDVISVGENFGWVDAMSARYTSVVMRDGREILIPNEDLVTQQVVNWSHSNARVRLDVGFGVSYASDPHKVRRIALETVANLDRVLRWPEPVCHLTKFNDFSLDFLLRFWIEDPVEGVTNVRGAVLLALWDAFKRENIEIPFPVRDLRFPAKARVTIAPDETAGVEETPL